MVEYYKCFPFESKFHVRKAITTKDTSFWTKEQLLVNNIIKLVLWLLLLFNLTQRELILYWVVREPERRLCHWDEHYFRTVW